MTSLLTRLLGSVYDHATVTRYADGSGELSIHGGYATLTPAEVLEASEFVEIRFSPRAHP